MTKSLLVRDSISIDKDSVIPPRQVPMNRNAFVYAQIYLANPGSQIMVRAIQDCKERQVLYEDTLAVDSTIVPVVFTYEKEKMVRGTCQLILEAAGERCHARTTKTLNFYGNINALTPASVDEMIEQLKYVAPGKEWERMKKAEGAEKLRLFQQFWKQRDVTPGTPENELFDEYYARVREANEKFGHGSLAGWTTQRGHVYILYGAPDRIERNDDPFHVGAKYEIWYYYDLERKFVFYDEYGFGDYKLVSGFIE